jgi:hypothetical protein
VTIATMPGASFRPSSGPRIPTALIAGVAAVLLLPTLGYGFGYDHGMMQYLGAAALRGQWPYADAWDTAFPGGIVLHMLAAAFGERSVLALRGLDLAIETGTLLLLYAAGRRLAGAWAGCFAAASYGWLYVGAGYYHTAQRDSFVVPCLLLAVLSLWDFLERPERRGALLRAGMWLAAACYFRPTYLLAGVLLVLWVALAPAGSRTRPQRLTDAGGVCLSAALLALAFPLTYLVAGRIDSIVELLRAQATIYPALERFTAHDVLRKALAFPPVLLWLGAALAVAPLARARQREGLLIVALAGTVLVRLWESKGWFYQFWPLIALLAVLAGAGWARAAGAIARRLSLQLREPAIALALALLAIASGGGVRTVLRRYRAIGTGVRASLQQPAAYDQLVADSPAQAALARWLDTHAPTNGRIQLWGPETNVLVATRRLSATRFTDPFLLFCSEHGLRLFSTCERSRQAPLQWKLRAEIVQTLQHSPPAYIVAHYSSGSLAAHEGASTAPDLPELRALLDARYVADTTIGIWTAFRRRD